MEEDATTHPRVRPRHQGDKIAPKLVDHADELHDQAVAMKKGSSPPGDESAAAGSGSGADTSGSDHQPAGGFDNTPIPRAPPGYTLRFTFHRGDNLPLRISAPFRRIRTSLRIYRLTCRSAISKIRG